MFLRFLVLIFALNVLAPPAMAVPCEMMDHSDMSSMSHDMSSMSHDMHNISGHTMVDSEPNCHMGQNHSCSSTECMTACATSLPLVEIENIKIFVTAVISNNPRDNLLSLYKIFLPLNTPPPLV